MSSDSLLAIDEERESGAGITLFDSHAHYFDERMKNEYPGGPDVLLPLLFDANIAGVMNVGTNPDTSRRALSQAAGYMNMYAAVGIHPEDAHGLTGAIEDHMASIEDLVVKNKSKVKAIGEIGLDYFRESYCGVPLSRELEKAYFDAQLSLSETLGLPVIIHDRDAHGDTVDMLMAHPNAYGVLHSYSGSAETAKELIKRGWMISFSGVITFKNASRLAEIVKTIPDDALLVETDCPYLAPHPYRGRMNHSGLMIETAKKMAELRGDSLEHIACLTQQNAKRLFKID